MTLESHPAATIFPMDEEHLADLAEDIKHNGQYVPIELLEGRVIDGRRRLAACEIAGVPPKTRDVAIDDPVAYVLSLNLHRRHLTPSQLAMVGARARALYDAQAKARQVEAGGDKKSANRSVVENLPQPIEDSSRARDAAGKAVGVSGKSIDFATRVLTSGTPELVKAVDEGRIAVSTAAVHAADPPEVQREVAERATRRYAPTSGGSEFGSVTQRERPSTPEPEPDNDVRSRGVGVRRAHEAVDCLKRIPKNDPLRARAFQIVTDWIRQNR